MTDGGCFYVVPADNIPRADRRLRSGYTAADFAVKDQTERARGNISYRTEFRLFYSIVDQQWRASTPAVLTAKRGCGKHTRTTTCAQKNFDFISGERKHNFSKTPTGKCTISSEVERTTYSGEYSRLDTTTSNSWWSAGFYLTACRLVPLCRPMVRDKICDDPILETTALLSVQAPRRLGFSRKSQRSGQYYHGEGNSKWKGSAFCGGCSSPGALRVRAVDERLFPFSLPEPWCQYFIVCLHSLTHPVARDMARGLAAHIAGVYIALAALDQGNRLQARKLAAVSYRVLSTGTQRERVRTWK